MGVYCEFVKNEDSSQSLLSKEKIETVSLKSTTDTRFLFTKKVARSGVANEKIRTTVSRIRSCSSVCRYEGKGSLALI